MLIAEHSELPYLCPRTQITKLSSPCSRSFPAIDPEMGCGDFSAGFWWVKFRIDIEHPLAWRVVQELGHILNYISTSEPLPSVFKPVSPPVYMNGGPKDYLSWVIENTHEAFTSTVCAEWLAGRLPRPIDDPAQWELEEDSEMKTRRISRDVLRALPRDSR